MTDRQIEAGLKKLSELEARAFTGTAQMVCIVIRAVLEAMREAGKEPNDQRE